MENRPGVKKEKQLRERYQVMRMFVQLHDQANSACLSGRTVDFHELCKLIGRLEYMHFEGGSIPEKI